MSKLKKMIMFLTIIIIIIILLIACIIMSETEIEENSNTITTQQNVENIVVDFKEVTNPHKYLTAKSCVEKYIGYIYQGDKASVYRILDSEYVQKFNILQEDVLGFVEKVEGPVNLRVEDMYVVEKNENEEQYYISGKLLQETIDGMEVTDENYAVTVTLDSENMIYSIIPKGYGGPFYEE